MLEAICRRAFFEFEVPIRRRAKAPRLDGTLSDWGAAYRLPALAEIDDEDPHTVAYAAWNDAGFYVAFEMLRRSGPPRIDLSNWWKSDGFRVCIDTRDARDNRRASRFCHFFYALPSGGGKNKRMPIVNVHPMSRAKEAHPPIDVAEIGVASHVERDSVSLELAFPASCLHGWEPREHPRIGFFYKALDLRRGGQHLTVNDELGWNVDPSTWATGVLVP